MENEQEILSALRNGDRQALGRLYDQFAPALYGLAIRITESEQQATKVVEQAFGEIWSSAKNFDSASTNLFSWAVDVVKNLAVENVAKTDQFDFEAYQSSHAVGADLREISQNIDKKHLRVIDLAYFQGMSENAIEQTLNIPVGTVSTRLRVGIRELRKALK